MSSEETEFQFVTGFKPSAKMLAKMHSLIEECVKECVDEKLEKALEKTLDKKLERIVKKYLKSKEKESEVIELKKIPKKQARSLVKSYIDTHEGCRTSDIIYDLALDPELVLEVLQDLNKKKMIKGEPL
jgi:hypothetical protein